VTQQSLSQQPSLGSSKKWLKILTYPIYYVCPISVFVMKELEQAKLVEYEGYSGRQGDEDTGDNIRRQANESLADSANGINLAGDSGSNSISQAQIDIASRLLRDDNGGIANIAGLNIYGTPLGAPTISSNSNADLLSYNPSENTAVTSHHPLLKNISSKDIDSDIQEAISAGGRAVEVNPLLIPHHAAMDSSYGIGAWNTDTASNYGPVLAGRYVAKRRHDTDKQVNY